MIWWSLLTSALANPLAEAVAAGDCPTVVKKAPTEDPWRVPLAWCRLKLGEPEAALKVLEPAPDGVLGEYARLIRARAHLALGQQEQAITALKALELPGEAGDEVTATLATIHAERGDLAALDALGTLEPKARSAYLRGLALKNAGQTAPAAAAFRAVWRDADVGGWDAKALEQLGDWTPSATDQAERLKALRKNGRIDEAAELSAEMGLADGPPLEMARVNLQARRYETSLVHWKRALGEPAKATGGAQAMFDYALTWARTGDYETAAVVYRRVIEAHPGTPQAIFASYKLGYMAYDEGDCLRAAPLFDDHLARYPRSKHATEAIWFSARCAWRVGEVGKAVDLWNQLIAEHPDSELASGAHYWLARSRGVRGDRIGEKAGLERVLRSYPDSGYAWFAAQRLEHRFPRIEPVEPPAWPAGLGENPAVKRAEALLEVGFRDWARGELVPVWKLAIDRSASLAIAWALLRAGDYRRAKQLARKYCSSPWKGGDPVAQQACTPQPERAIVAQVADRYELDPLVPYGIMTAESALKPWVTSHAGARGLMQLMPKLGEEVHQVLYPERPYDPDDLYSAPYNASMGTAELGLKRQALKGVLQDTDLPAVIASYNGGEEAVRRWLTAYDGPPEFDEFAEDIGYVETRRYVKRVLGYVMAYRWTYGDPPASESLEQTPPEGL